MRSGAHGDGLHPRKKGQRTNQAVASHKWERLARQVEIGSSDPSNGVQEYLPPLIPEKGDLQHGVERVSRKAALKSAQNAQPS